MDELRNSPAWPVLADAERRKKRAVRDALGMAAVALVIPIVVLGGISIWLPAAVGVYTYYRRLRGEGIVVWLRRFHPSYGNRFRFHQTLGAACPGLGAPVTVQDRSFRFSYAAATARVLPFISLMFLAALLSIGLVAVTVASLFGFSPAAGIVGAVIGLAVVGWTLEKLLRRTGLAVFTGQAGAAKAKRRLARLARKPRSPGIGIEILKCSDDIWQDVVTDALRSCRAVVIDVTDVTSHIEWEIRQALAIVGDSRIVLAAEEGTSIEDVIERLASDVGSSEARRWVTERFVTYPATRPSIDERRKAGKEVTERLREAIALALGASKEEPSSPLHVA